MATAHHPRNRPVPTPALLLLLLAGATLAGAAAVHSGAVLEAGSLRLHDPFAGAYIPEAVLAAVAVLAASGSALSRGSHRRLFLAAVLLELAGVGFGLSVTLRDPSRVGDLAYHLGLTLILLLALAALRIWPAPKARG
jgi:hypothetical protein